MDKFHDPSQPLYSLLMDSTSDMSLCLIFFDDQSLRKTSRLLICCEGGVIVMEKFDDAPQPLY